VTDDPNDHSFLGKIMSYFLFIDESGHDGFPPYEVLAGVAIEDRDLWNCILAIHSLEEQIFGERISKELLELKGKKLLKAKVFKHALQMEPIEYHERRELALSCLQKGKTKTQPSRRELTALAQAKIYFVQSILDICARFRIKAFASIVNRDAERDDIGNYLRKDYAFLFERYFYFLEDHKSMGTVIFDELEKSQCHILIKQMEEYFINTDKGKNRSSYIVPEPMFVHSELTTAIQIADLVAYIISWGVRLRDKMTSPAREELNVLSKQVLSLRYNTTRDGHSIWSFVPINSLRLSDLSNE
jgi:hypothetical protein